MVLQGVESALDSAGLTVAKFEEFWVKIAEISAETFPQGVGDGSVGLADESADCGELVCKGSHAPGQVHEDPNFGRSERFESSPA
jgi:hypothetical protein